MSCTLETRGHVVADQAALSAAICRLRLRGVENPTPTQVEDEVLDFAAHRCAAGAPWAVELSREYLKNLRFFVGAPVQAAILDSEEWEHGRIEAFYESL